MERRKACMKKKKSQRPIPTKAKHDDNNGNNNTTGTITGDECRGVTGVTVGSRKKMCINTRG